MDTPSQLKAHPCRGEEAREGFEAGRQQHHRRELPLSHDSTATPWLEAHDHLNQSGIDFPRLGLAPALVEQTMMIIDEVCAA